MDSLTTPTPASPSSVSPAPAGGATHPDWKAPSADGELLLWPDVPTLLAQTTDNHRQLDRAENVRIQNTPLPELRRHVRKYLGAPPDQILVATGHQIELYHPGVWAKNLFINELASKLDGAAYHFAVDTDAPKHLVLRWPGGAEPITDDFRLATADWADLLEAPTPSHLSEVERAFERSATTWPFEPMMPAFFAALRRSLLESSELPRVLVNATHQLDWDLGLRHYALLASPIWRSPAYLLFVHHLLAHAPEFAYAYNQALADYRQRTGTTNPGRPWPDLRTTTTTPGPVNELTGAPATGPLTTLEVPFWLDALTPGTRSRATVVRRTDHWSLLAPSGEAFPLDPNTDGWTAASKLSAFLTRHNLRLSPRALTLTAFLRLCVVDQFVHGIGGARYDQVTDAVLHRFFRATPPHFSVTTATLLFPTAKDERRPDLRALQREGRRLRHTLPDADKMEIVRRIQSLPRNSMDRRELFFDLHRRLRASLQHERYKDWEQRFEQAKLTSQSQSDLFDRELFYAVQPRDRLQSLLDRYHREFAGA